MGLNFMVTLPVGVVGAAYERGSRRDTVITKLLQRRAEQTTVYSVIKKILQTIMVYTYSLTSAKRQAVTTSPSGIDNYHTLHSQLI